MYSTYNEGKSVAADTFNKTLTYVDFNHGNNEEDSGFEVGVHLRIQKSKNIFAKGYSLNWSEEDSVIKNAKNTMPWTLFISGHDGKEDVGLL